MVDQVPSLALEFLLASQNKDGGWPYSIGVQSYPEPTCYSLLSLFTVEEALSPSIRNLVASKDLGVLWLGNHLDANGALVLDNDSAPNWGTSLAVLTFSFVQADIALRDRAINYLLSFKGLPLEPNPIAPMNTQLIGWPWVSNTFSWVEPTSYAILALRQAGYAAHPRVAEAERLLLDRVCVDGGWNYGNPIVFDKVLDAFVPTTAWALMALHDVAAAKEAVERGLAFLQQATKQYPSTLSLALTILCLNLFEEQTEPFVSLLLERQQVDGSWRHMIHLTALSVLALQSVWGGINVFKA